MQQRKSARAKHLLLRCGLWCIGLIALSCMLPVAEGQTHATNDRATGTEWPTYAADLAGTRYRPLDRSTRRTSASWKLPGGSRRQSRQSSRIQTGRHALMVNHVLYATAGSRRAIVALDSRHGRIALVHGEHEEHAELPLPPALRTRLAYWSAGRKNASYT